MDDCKPLVRVPSFESLILSARTYTKEKNITRAHAPVVSAKRDELEECCRDAQPECAIVRTFGCCGGGQPPDDDVAIFCSAVCADPVGGAARERMHSRIDDRMTGTSPANERTPGRQALLSAMNALLDRLATVLPHFNDVALLVVLLNVGVLAHVLLKHEERNGAWKIQHSTARRARARLPLPPAPAPPRSRSAAGIPARFPPAHMPEDRFHSHYGGGHNVVGTARRESPVCFLEDSTFLFLSTTPSTASPNTTPASRSNPLLEERWDVLQPKRTTRGAGEGGGMADVTDGGGTYEGEGALAGKGGHPLVTRGASRGAALSATHERHPPSGTAGGAFKDAPYGWRQVLLVGPGGYRSPRHKVPYNSRDEGSKCVG